MRLGYACTTLGMEEAGTRTVTKSRWDQGLVSEEDLAAVYAHNAELAARSIAHSAAHGLTAFRLSSDMFPLLDHAEGARAHVPSLRAVKRLARDGDVHLSTHPSQWCVLSSPDERVTGNTLRALEDESWVTSRVGTTGSITLHGGGVYGDRASAGERLAKNVRRARSLRKRLALENDERLWTVPELLAATHGSVPIVFDILHFQANPRSLALDDELGLALRSWGDRVPEVHYSEQAAGKVRGAHADWIDGKELLAFARKVHEVAEGRDVAVIVEAKKKDLAIARAYAELGKGGRADLVRFFPDLARAPLAWWRDAKRFEAA